MRELIGYVEENSSNAVRQSIESISEDKVEIGKQYNSTVLNE